jgi:hypothetical protein
MRDTVARIVLLRSYPSPPSGAGRAIFTFGKTIGIIGRAIVTVFLVAVAVAAVVDRQTLLLFFLIGYAVTGLALVTEVVSSVLMFLGNWVTARAVRRNEREA